MSSRSGASSPGPRARTCSRPSSISCRSSPRASRRRTWSRSSRWRSSCRSRRRSIRHGGRPGSIRWRRCAMNDAGRFAALTLEAIERRYGRGDTTVEVLNGASLALYAGQSVALIAPSGAGKSTLLHLAGLLERPSGGEVTVAGSPTSSMTDDERTALRRNQIGFVYQFHHLLPEFSALENLVLPQMIAGLPRLEAANRARELLGYLGLAKRETHRPAELS